MTIQQFIEKAIEGGWRPLLAHQVWYANWNNRSLPRQEARASYVLHEILLDPEAWKAVGKVEGWEKWSCGDCYMPQFKAFLTSDADQCSCCLAERNRSEIETWKMNMHRMIDALAEGKSVEEYLETL